MIRDPFIRMIVQSTWPTSYTNENGYVKRRSKEGREAYEQRIVAELSLGYQLPPWKHVHHIYGCRWDNSRENLCVMDDIDHIRYHEWFRGYRTHRGDPTPETQLRMLKIFFNGILLGDRLSQFENS